MMMMITFVAIDLSDGCDDSRTIDCTLWPWFSRCALSSFTGEEAAFAFVIVPD